MHSISQGHEDISTEAAEILLSSLQLEENEGLADSDVTVSTDGVVRSSEAGSKSPFNSARGITLTPGLFHAFWAEKATGKVLIGEVSMVKMI